MRERGSPAPASAQEHTRVNGRGSPRPRQGWTPVSAQEHTRVKEHGSPRPRERSGAHAGEERSAAQASEHTAATNGQSTGSGLGGPVGLREAEQGVGDGRTIYRCLIH